MKSWICGLAFGLLLLTGASAQVFHKIVPGDGSTLQSLHVTPEGNILALTGYQFSYQAQSYGMEIYAMDSTGEFLWAKRFSNMWIDRIFPMAGYIAFAGHTNPDSVTGAAHVVGLINASGEPVWVRKLLLSDTPYDNSQILQKANGNLLFTLSLSGGPVWIETESDGDLVYAFFAQEQNSGGKNPAFGTTATPDGGAITTTKSAYWPCILKLDSTGTITWSKVYKSYDHYFHPKTIQRAADGSYYIAGMVQSNINSQMDAWIMKTDDSGNFLWGRLYHHDNFYGMFKNLRFLDNGNLWLSGMLMEPNGDEHYRIFMELDANGGVTGMKAVTDPSIGTNAELEGHFHNGNFTYGYSWIHVEDSTLETELHICQVQENGPFHCNEHHFEMMELNFSFAQGVDSAHFDADNLESLIQPATISWQNWSTDVADGCEAFASVKDEIPAANPVIFPNPAKDNLNIVFSEGQELVKAEIYNVQGEIVFATTLSATLTQQLHISGLVPGMYVLRTVYADGSIQHNRFVKE